MDQVYSSNYENKCPTCGKEFIPSLTGQEFCSDDCKHRNFYASGASYTRSNGSTGKSGEDKPYFKPFKNRKPWDKK